MSTKIKREFIAVNRRIPRNKGPLSKTFECEYVISQDCTETPARSIAPAESCNNVPANNRREKPKTSSVPRPYKCIPK